jgi:hypothetical protein
MSRQRAPLVALLTLVTVLLLGGRARADDPLLWISPGVKLAYTFGRGFTMGLELSLTWAPNTWEDMKDQPYALGGALNLDTNFKRLFRLRLGGQLVGPFIGLEIGPALVVDEGRTRLGIGFTPWVGAFVIPYYTYTLVFSGPDLHELGAYFKVHLNTEMDFSSSSSSHHDWD